MIDSGIKILPISPLWWIEEIWRHCWWSSWKGAFWPCDVLLDRQQHNLQLVQVSAGLAPTGVLSALFDELSLLGLKQRDIVIFTDRVRSTREGYVLTRVSSSIHPSVCPHLGGVTEPGPGGRGTPAKSMWGGGLLGVTPPQVPPSDLGVPHLRYLSSDLVRGVPTGGYPTSVNRWSTWYAAMGMPLAFTQDFLFS